MTIISRVNIWITFGVTQVDGELFDGVECRNTGKLEGIKCNLEYNTRNHFNYITTSRVFDSLYKED